MPVERLHAEAMIEDDAVAVDAEVVRVQHPSVVGGEHGHRCRDGEVEAKVDLLIDLLALIEVGAMIGEERLHL